MGGRSGPTTGVGDALASREGREARHQTKVLDPVTKTAFATPVVQWKAFLGGINLASCPPLPVVKRDKQSSRLERQRSNDARNITILACRYSAPVQQYPVGRLHRHRRNPGGIQARLCLDPEGEGAGQRPSPLSRRSLFQVEAAGDRCLLLQRQGDEG